MNTCLTSTEQTHPSNYFLIWWHIYFTLMRWGFSNFLYNHPQLSVYLPLNCEQASHIFLDVWKRQEELFDVLKHVQSQCLNIVFLLTPQAYVIHMNGLQAFEKVYHIITICLNCCSQRSFPLMSMPLWQQSCRIPPWLGTYLEVNALFSVISL